MSQMQYMRRLKVPVPEELRQIVREADFLRFGIVYERPVKGEDYFGKICIYAVPRRGGEPCFSFPLIKEIPLRTDNPSNYASFARALAKNEQQSAQAIARSKH